MKDFLLFIWQAPQAILSFLLLFYFDFPHPSAYIKGVPVYRVSAPGWGIALGTVIILDHKYDKWTEKHEYGHCLQSHILGPLYLLIVGLPSATMNLLTRAGVLSRTNYYNRWPESWANRLAGI